MAKILIVEDEPDMVLGLKDNFEFEGYEVVTASDGAAGLERARSEHPDLLVLDIMLPKLSGLEVCKTLRAEGFQAPIVMLTARGQEIDKVVGLELGADDYVTKPFSMPELLARMRVALRRRAGADDGGSVIEVDRLRMDLAAHTVTMGGAEVQLTPIEFRLLAALARHAGRVLTHDFLLREVWGPGSVGQHHYLRVYMAQLRRKLEPDPARPRFLITELGVGYRLKDTGS